MKGRAWAAIGAAGLLAAGLVALNMTPEGEGPADDRPIEEQLREAVDALRPFPRRIDQATELVEARAEGRRMVYVYRILPPAAFDAAQQRAVLERTACDAAPMRNALRDGVSFLYEYRAEEPSPPVTQIEITRCP